MWQPRSIRLHLAAVFFLFFALVAGLGAFSMWRLANFNSLSADVAEVWLPTTRALGDLNNYTSDFRAFEGSALLTSDPNEIAATEKQMTELDRTIADAERNFERIRHDAAEAELYDQFKTRWNAYRSIVNQMLVLSRSGRRDDALQIYGNSSRLAYNAASDTLGQLTDQAVASAQVASDRTRARLSPRLLADPSGDCDRGTIGRCGARPYQPVDFSAASSASESHAPARRQ